MFIATLFTIAKMWKHPKCLSVNKWIKEICFVYTMESFSSVKKNTLPFMIILMHLEGIILSEMSDREKQIPHDLTCILILKKKHTHTHTHTHKPIYIERELFVVAGGQG